MTQGPLRILFYEILHSKIHSQLETPFIELYEF